MVAYSHYYEQLVHLTEEEVLTLLSIYNTVAFDLNFIPEANYKNIWELQDEGAISHLLYHVEEFGKEHKLFDEVAHIFKF